MESKTCFQKVPVPWKIGREKFDFQTKLDFAKRLTSQI